MSMNDQQDLPRSNPLTLLVKKHLWKEKWFALLGILSMLGFSTMVLLSPWPIKIIIDQVLLDKPMPATFDVLLGWLPADKHMLLIVLGVAIALISGLNGVFSYFQISCTTQIGQRLVHTVRIHLLGHLQRLSLSFHNHSHSGELLTKIQNDTRALKSLFADLTLNAASQIITVVGMFAIMMAMNWQLSMVLLVTVPILGYVLLSLNQRIKRTVSTQRKMEGKMSARINDILGSIALIQAFGRENYEEERFQRASKKYLKEGMGAAKTQAAGLMAVLAISGVGTAVTVIFGAWQALEGRMTPGDLLIFISYVRKIYKPFRQLTKLSANFSRAMVSFNRIGEVLVVTPAIHDHPQSIQTPPLKGDILFQNVSFGYEGDRAILNQASFHILPGQRVALVGASGAGKSTIVNLLLHLYAPQEGTIFLDGIDLVRYQRESLREQIGIVLQDTTLFGISMSENIAYGKPDATIEEIEEAARQANAHDFIMALPDGYDTELGERGCTLSGGQRQRICLARTFIKHPSILVLDEPTSAIDPQSTSLIFDAIARVQEGKTTLVIAHQFSTMYQFDQILVLKDGHIIEHGPHDQLLDLKGHYYQLFQRQSAEDIRVKAHAQ